MNPVKYLVRKSKKWIPPGFGDHSLYEVTRYFVNGFSVPDFTEKAAAVSYNFIMAIPPTCLFIFTLIPVLPFVSRHGLKHQLHGLITDIIPSKVYNKSIVDFIDSFIDGSKIGLISFTFFLSLFFASNAVMGLMRSFNKDHVGFKKIKGLKKRGRALMLTIILFGLLVVCLSLLLMQNTLLDMLGISNKHVRLIIIFGKWIFIIALIFYSYAFIYKYAPSTKKKWQLFSPGAVIATLLSILVTIVFTTFVNNFGRYNILYGSIGTIMVIMSMIFINSMVVILGFEFNLSINTLQSISEGEKTAQTATRTITNK